MKAIISSARKYTCQNTPSNRQFFKLLHFNTSQFASRSLIPKLATIQNEDKSQSDQSNSSQIPTQNENSRQKVSKNNPFQRLTQDNQYFFSEPNGGVKSGVNNQEFGTQGAAGAGSTSSASSNLVDYYTLPKLSKQDIDTILQEIQGDINSIQTPSELVKNLDKFIVSQSKAKKVVAQAIRNKMVQGEMRESMRPSNILIHGRSGSGKTEIFRRIAFYIIYIDSKDIQRTFHQCRSYEVHRSRLSRRRHYKHNCRSIQKDILITKDYVEERTKSLFQNRDFRQYTM